VAHEAPDDIYPFYAYDLVRIYRQGLYCLDGRLRLRSSTALHVHFAAILTVDCRGSVTFDTHRLCEPPCDYRAYKELLFEGVRKVLENARDPARKRSYRPLVSLSKGYDSTAAAVLARAAGCTEAFTYIDTRSADPSLDSGAENAQFLGMSCNKYGRWQYLDLDGCAEAEFGYGPLSSNVPLAAAEDQLAGRVLISGDSGDSIWEPERSKVCVQLSKPWIRFTNCLSQIEFRLRLGYFIFLPASVAARHNRSIYDIATSEELRPWSVGAHYDRPIPRRLAEEAGLTRESFGTRKIASSHSHLTDPARFSKMALDDYRHFVHERHAEIPRLAYHYWRARARWLHSLWGAVGFESRRYVDSTFLQRQFPFSLNAIPIRVPWDFMFTFQWTVASMRSRYTLSAERSGDTWSSTRVPTLEKSRQDDVRASSISASSASSASRSIRETWSAPARPSSTWPSETVIASFLIKQAGLKRTEANTGAVTLIQRFGSAANLNIHLHCLVLDGVYRNSTAVFHEVAAPTSEALQALQQGFNH
jgi:hypothetical protein